MMGQGDTLDKIVAYLVEQTTLTLCCVDQGTPYCCNCFYVLDRSSMVFYITSSLNTHHSSVMLKNHKVAGTVSGQTQSITHIQGVQYQGSIRLLADDDEDKARRLFCAAYPIAKLKKAPMWEIMLNTLKMTDNQLGFGKKWLWSRDD